MDQRTAPGFQDLLAKFEFAELENHSNTVFGLWSDMRLAYFNPGWFTFAEANGGEPAISHDWRLGRSVFDAIPAVMQRFYTERHKRMRRLNGGPKGRQLLAPAVRPGLWIKRV